MCAPRRLRSACAAAQSDQIFAVCMKKLWVLGAHREDSDQTGWMPRLIQVFVGRTCHFVDFVMLRLICSRKGVGTCVVTVVRAEKVSNYTAAYGGACLQYGYPHLFELIDKRLFMAIRLGYF